MLSSEIQISMDSRTICPHHVKNIRSEVIQGKFDTLILILMPNCPYLEAPARASCWKCANVYHIRVPGALDAQNEPRIHSKAYENVLEVQNALLDVSYAHTGAVGRALDGLGRGSVEGDDDEVWTQTDFRMLIADLDYPIPVSIGMPPLQILLLCWKIALFGITHTCGDFRDGVAGTF